MPALALVQFVFFLIWLTAGLPLRQLRHQQEVPPFVSHLIGGQVGELGVWLGGRDVCHFDRVASYVSLSCNSSFVREDEQFPSLLWTDCYCFWGVYLIICLFSLLLRKLCFFLHIFCKNKSVCPPVFNQTCRETDDTSFFFLSWSYNQQLRGLWFNVRGHLSSVKCFSSNRSD